MDAYKIAIADDHALFRRGLCSILQASPGYQVVGEAGDGLELLELLARKRVEPQLAILDISMPNLRGLELIPRLRRDFPGLKILVITMHADREYLFQALGAGADGYLLKKDADTELFAALAAIRNGKTYVTPQFAADAADLWPRLRGGSERSALTDREREVLKLVAEGQSNREVADKLFISVHTVERHRANIMKKLDLKNTADLVKYAIQKGFV
jgi:DNA-binding NarL/FixJ family response regulator